MADIGIARPGTSRKVGACASRLGFWLAIIALLMLAGAPFGWRAGVVSFRTGFFVLMQYAAYLGIAAAVLSLVALALWRGLGAGGRLMALAGLVLGGVLFYVPWHYDQIRRTVPPIDDITTDTDSPPAFSAVLPARAAEKANSAVYGGPGIAKLQHQAYPDIVPLMVALPPAEAFARALDTAKSMPGWMIVATDPASGRIEASQRSFWFGFTDDMVIRVAADGTGSRIDMRSESRLGRSDFGVNAARIRRYMAALKQHIG